MLPRMQAEVVHRPAAAPEYLLASADEGSFAGAARRLEVSVSAVQKLISALERRLGVRLFERHTRGLTLTAIGTTYLESCRPLVGELAALDEAVGRTIDRAGGTLVVGAHAQLAHHLLLPALPRFHASYPDIQIDFRVIHRLSDADAATVDVFVVHGWAEAADLVHRHLGRAESWIAATPAYWAAHGLPQHPSELAGHVCLLIIDYVAALLRDIPADGVSGAPHALTERPQ